MMNLLALGKKIRQSRVKSGMTQIQLAERVGLSYQQIQKYEKGRSQMNVSRLFDIAEALETDPLALLDDAIFAAKISEPRKRYTTKPARGAAATAQEKRLIEHYRKIKNAAVRDDIVKLIKSIAAMRLT